jgi:hypothetical protein
LDFPLQLCDGRAVEFLGSGYDVVFHPLELAGRFLKLSADFGLNLHELLIHSKMQVALERHHLDQGLPDPFSEVIFNLLDLLGVDVRIGSIKFLDLQLNLVKLARLIGKAALQIGLNGHHELPETFSMFFPTADGFYLV